MRFPRVTLAVAALALTIPAPHRAPVQIKEWPVPWQQTRPRDPYVGPDGKVWFVGQTGDYVAYLVPANGEFKQYALDRGAGPHNLIVDKEGMVWYAGNRAGHIGKLDPRTGTITKIPMPDPRAHDPHTLVFDSHEDIWFTLQGANRIGKLTTRSSTVRLVPVPTPDARPYGIAVDSKDRPWIVLVGSNKLATVDPASMTLREIPIPRQDARPRRIAITPDDRIWYVDYAGGFLGRFDPATNKFDEWPAPSGARASLYAMTSDEKGRVWMVETGPRPNKLVGFDPRTGEFFSETAVPSGAETIRHMTYHRPSRTIWFGTDANTIGRAIVPE